MSSHAPVYLRLALAALLVVGASAGAATYTWNGGDAGSGAWSSAANWDTVPTSADTNELVFSANPNGFVSSNDLVSNPFALSGLTFGSGLGAPFTLFSVNALQFSFSANQSVSNHSAGKVTLQTPIRFKATNRDLKFAGTGAGDMEVAGIYYFPHQSTLTVDAGLSANVILNQIDLWTRSSYFYNKMPVATGRELRLNGPIRFTAVSDPTQVGIYDVGRTVVNGQFIHVGAAGGSLDLNPSGAGIVVLNNPAGNFADTIDISFGSAGGTIDLGGYTHTVRNAAFSGSKVTNGVLAVQNFYLDYGTLSIAITNAAGYEGNLTKRLVTNNDSWITTPMTYSGATRLIASDITLQGANGVANQAAVVIDMAPLNGENSSLILNNGGVGNNHNDRLSDTKSVTMGAGRLLLIGNADVPTTEVIGDVIFSRYAQIHVDAAAGGVASLTGSSITRSDYGTLYVTGDSLGSAAGANVSQVKFTTPPPLTSGSLGGTGAPLVPWAATGENYPSDRGRPVTVDTDGFRPLTASEYVVNAMTPGANVYVTGNLDMGGSDATIKSLSLRPPANGTYTLTGTGAAKLTITDGVLVSGKSNQEPENVITIPYLTFGPNSVTAYEGILHIYSPNSVNATVIDSAIVDNDGNAVSLTKSGPNNVRLRGMNAIGGTLRIHEGTLSVQDNPNTAGLSETTTVQNVILSAGQYATLDIGTGARLNTTGTGTVVTVLRNLGGDGITGAGTLGLSGDVQTPATIGGTTARIIPAIDGGTAAHTFNIANGTPSPDVAMEGVISGSGVLTKTGAGALEWRANNTYSGNTVVSAGQLILKNAGGAITASPVVSLEPGTSLTLDNGSANNNDRLGASQNVVLNAAEFRLTGNASAASTETFGTLTLSRGLSTLTVDAAAGGVASLTAGTLTRTARGSLLLRGDSLGNAAAANVGQFWLGSAPTLVGGGALGTSSAPIMPFIFGDSNIATTGSRETGSLVTYDANGFRLLNRATEMTASYAAGVNAFGGGSVSSDLEINSLFVQHGATVNGIAGRKLTITSGMIMHASGYDALNISVTYLTFGNNAVIGCEGIIYVNKVGDPTDTISSSIVDNGANAVSITKSGMGRLVLSGVSTYSGPTTVNAGALRVDGGNDRLPTNTLVHIDAAGLFDLYSRTQTVSGVTGWGAITNAHATPGHLILNMTNDLTFCGSVLGNVNLTKDGASTLTMTGALFNTTGALTINAGTLVYAGLGNTGQVGTIVVKDGGTLSVTGGVLVAIDATFENGSTLAFHVAGTNAASASGLQASGTLTFEPGSRATVTLAPGVLPVPGRFWYVGTAPTIGNLPRAPRGFRFVVQPGSPESLVLEVGSVGSVFIVK